MPLKTGSVTRAAPTSQDETALLRWWLDWQRDALFLNCEGLSDEELRRRAVPPSALSLLGIVRHMTLLERIYWRRIFLGDGSVSIPQGDEEDFDGVEEADVRECLAAWAEERRFADSVLATRSLDSVGQGGQTVRFWVLKLMNEYARHNGHADLLRECIDGRVGE
jgi:hypothetical protein